jgi:hypothetical protein
MVLTVERDAKKLSSISTEKGNTENKKERMF